AWVVPLVVVGCIVWVGMLALGNARERRGEVGILRAIGLRAGRILAIFLARAVLVGLIGAAAGYAAGFAVAAAWDAIGSAAGDAVGVAALFAPWLLAAALVAAPLLAAVASLVPAMLAAREDPAVILREG
ncbi:MAG: FtsX-like permease family protein, partial [Planctomycetes bacterium]|nr:FtsX-like permease family protein [Planctomycetota bacterium]